MTKFFISCHGNLRLGVGAEQAEHSRSVSKYLVKYLKMYTSRVASPTGHQALLKAEGLPPRRPLE